MEQQSGKIKVTRNQLIKQSGLSVNQYNYMRDKKVFPIEEESAGPGFPVIYSEDAIQIAKKYLQKRNIDHGSGRSKNYALADDTRGSNSSQVQHIINKSDDTKWDAEVLSTKEREAGHSSEGHGFRNSRPTNEADSTTASGASGPGECRQGE